MERMMKGRTIRIFLADGSPKGILTAEIGNWTGKLVVASRSMLVDLESVHEQEEAMKPFQFFAILCLVSLSGICCTAEEDPPPPPNPLDTTFGTNGVAGYDSGGDDFAHAIALQADSNALVAGTINTGADWDIVLLRFK